MDDSGVQVITESNGDFIIMGNIATPNRGQDICFIHTDAFGNSVAPVQVYGGLFDDNGYAIRKTNDGYIIAGSTEKYSGANKDILLVQIDNQGKQLNSYTIGTSGNDEAFDVQVLQNGNYVLTGYSDSIISKKKDLMIAIVSPAGKLLAMDLAGFEDDEAGNSIVALDTSTFYVAGYTKSRPQGTTYSNYYIMKCKYLGLGLFFNSLIYDRSDGNSPTTSIIPDSSGNFIVSCNDNRPQQQSTTEIRIIKIDKDLNILWDKNFGENAYNSVSNIYIHNDNIFVIGTSGSINQYGDILILEVDKNGENAVYHYSGDGNSYTGRSLDFTSDNGYIITGANKTNETSVISLIKLNSMFKLQ